MRRGRGGVLAWRVSVGVVGAVFVAAGLVMILTPGPGWAAVFLGLAILSTEFAWAARLRRAVERGVRSGASWLRRRPVWQRVFAAAVTLGVVVAAAVVAVVVYDVHRVWE